MHTGRCLCGGVRFRIESELTPIQICHCSQCRRAQGTPFASNIPIRAAAFRLLSGAELLNTFESSPGKRRVFCGTCGSPLYSQKDALPDLLRIRAGLIDGPLEVRPVTHAYVASKADWWCITDDLPQFAGAATPPRPLPNRRERVQDVGSDLGPGLGSHRTNLPGRGDISANAGSKCPRYLVNCAAVDLAPLAFAATFLPNPTT